MAIDMNKLPALKGTEKQVAWAEKIRAERIEKILTEGRNAYAMIKMLQSRPRTEAEKRLDIERIATYQAKFDFAMDAAKTTSAAWWIEHRGDDRYEIRVTYPAGGGEPTITKLY